MESLELYYQNSSLGKLGECTGIRPECGSYYTFHPSETLKVGDVVSFYEYEQIYTKVVTKNTLENEYGVYGFGNNRLNFKKLTKVLSYKDLTEDILRKFSGSKNTDDFKIKKITKKEMTIEQIEKELGYEVKIVKENAK